MADGRFVSAGEHIGRDFGPDIQRDTLQLDLASGEYISEVSGRSGAWMDNLTIRTSKGRSLVAGGSGGGPFHVLKKEEGKRLVALKGGVGGHLHCIGGHAVDTV